MDPDRFLSSRPQFPLAVALRLRAVYSIDIGNRLAYDEAHNEAAIGVAINCRTRFP